MRSAAQAYQSVAKQTASPRDLEANLLLKAAARLQSIQERWESEYGQLDEALLYNRKLWSIFLTSATSSENQLPSDVKQNVANLGLFVMNHTMNVLQDPKPESLRSLILINRELAAGLRTIR
jgi:flagellar protein FlaF